MDADINLPSPKDLVIGFESLGHDCEFGLFQRQVGVEPLGLMRFTGHTLPELREGLQSRFDGLAEDVGLYINGGEWITHARIPNLHFHTFQSPLNVDEEGMLVRETKRLAFLRRKMLDDLNSGEKIFVRRSAESPAEGDVQGLWSDLNAFGANTLLWVSPSDDSHPDGTLRVEHPGLLRGYLNKRPTTTKFIVDHAAWMKLCWNAHSAFRGLPFTSVTEKTYMPSEPVRLVRAENTSWQTELALGGNGRVRHTDHNSLGCYYQKDDVLHVKWDVWPNELFLKRRGVFRSVELLGLADRA